MGKQKEHPRYEVVSLRVTMEEKEIITEIAKNNDTSVDDLLRGAARYAGLFKRRST